MLKLNFEFKNPLMIVETEKKIPKQIKTYVVCEYRTFKPSYSLK